MSLHCYHDKDRTTYSDLLGRKEGARRTGGRCQAWLDSSRCGRNRRAINVRRTAAQASLTAGVGLLFGASRTKDKLTVTFVRTEGFIARKRLDKPTRELAICRASFERAQANTGPARRNRDDLLRRALT